MLMLDLLSGIGSTTLVLVISRLMVVRVLREEVVCTGFFASVLRT